MFEQKQFLSAVEQICEEKGISKDRVIETVEAALAAAYKRDYAKRGQNIRVDLDELTGNMKVFLLREVVKIDAENNVILEMAPRETEDQEQQAKAAPKELKTTEPDLKNEKKESEQQADEEEERQREYNADRYISLEEAQEHLKDPKLGDIVEIELEPPSDFGRIAAQTAKQVIIQRIREAERESMFDEYQDKVGEVINGTVQRMEGRNVLIDLGRATGILFPDEQIPREFYSPGQRIKVYLNKIENNVKGPGITLSRTCPELVKELLKMEVPEIASGAVEVKAIAREAGSRTKLAVATKEEGIDPVGACVGQKGTRIQTIISELNGEKIDVIEWTENVDAFIARALSPAKVLSVELNTDTHDALVNVEKDQLSLAIGRHGQNVRLAAKLTGYKIDVKGTDAPMPDTKNGESEDESTDNMESDSSTEEEVETAQDKKQNEQQPSESTETIEKQPSKNDAKTS